MCFVDAQKKEELLAMDRVDKVHKTIFKYCETVVYDLQGYHMTTYPSNAVDANIASALLGVSTTRYNTRSPVEMLYSHINPDIKMYALRERLKLPDNKMLAKLHNIRCKGPVVVSILQPLKLKTKDCIMSRTLREL